MSELTEHIQELKAAEAFSRQAGVFDQLFGNNPVIMYKRRRVREHILALAQPGASMLELNCGTGEDALYFAERGFYVHATDISEGMLEALQRKISATGSGAHISWENCSFTQLDRLRNRGPFDHIYSNFGGLNCTGDLGKVLNALPLLLRPGGTATLVIISRFCLWETLLVFKGKLRTAFRRFFSNKGRRARIEERYFTCWYYRPSVVRKMMEKEFNYLGHEGLCCLVPPSYIENFAQKYPGLFRFLQQKENRWKQRWPWKNWGDYFIISFRKKDQGA
jgi:ubiquinone/menaquinone biosynthesis C-methylase UbiE